MAINITRPKENIFSVLKSIQGSLNKKQDDITFWFSGDGTTVEYILKAGWKPKMVFVDGLLKRSGSSEDYEVTYDGFLYKVVFEVAPPDLSDIGIVCSSEGR